jgi:hypothetical protein
MHVILVQVIAAEDIDDTNIHAAADRSRFKANR